MNLNEYMRLRPVVGTIKRCAACILPLAIVFFPRKAKAPVEHKTLEKIKLLVHGIHSNCDGCGARAWLFFTSIPNNYGLSTRHQREGQD